jgi:hypothetical protein
MKTRYLILKEVVMLKSSTLPKKTNQIFRCLLVVEDKKTVDFEDVKTLALVTQFII